MELLTTNWHTHSLSISVENRNVDIRRQVATMQVRNEIGVPIEFSVTLEVIE